MNRNTFKKEISESTELVCPNDHDDVKGSYCHVCGCELHLQSEEYVKDLWEYDDELDIWDNLAYNELPNGDFIIYNCNDDKLKYTYFWENFRYSIDDGSEHTIPSMRDSMDEFEEVYMSEFKKLSDFFEDYDGELITIDYGIIFIQ
ncbi:MAG: hypothetical protein GF317_24520 [Candidatus Lokiarchaeota archaeon]|nr:hypothetical protein [Candidatus Lokiarchaeota archaeon]